MRIYQDEIKVRLAIEMMGIPASVISAVEEDFSEPICSICNAICYLSFVSCSCGDTSSTCCLMCTVDEQKTCACPKSSKSMKFRVSNVELLELMDKTSQGSETVRDWVMKLTYLLSDEQRPSISLIERLVAEGKGFSRPPLELAVLEDFMVSVHEWIKKAKRILIPRTMLELGSQTVDTHSQRLMNMEELQQLLREGEDLCIETPEIQSLRSVVNKAKSLQQKFLDAASRQGNFQPELDLLEREALDLGFTLRESVPNTEAYEQATSHWKEMARKSLTTSGHRDELDKLLAEARNLDLRIDEEPLLHALSSQITAADQWIEEFHQLEQIKSEPLEKFEDLLSRAHGIRFIGDHLERLRHYVLEAKKWKKDVLNARRRRGSKLTEELINGLLKSAEDLPMTLPEQAHFQTVLENSNQFRDSCAAMFLKDPNQHELPTVLGDLVKRAEVAWFRLERLTTETPCFCLDMSRELLMLQCSNCGQSYHAHCVHQATPSTNYLCPICDPTQLADIAITLRPKLESVRDLLDSAVQMAVVGEEVGLLSALVHDSKKWGDLVSRKFDMSTLSAHDLRILSRIGLLIEIELPEHRLLLENLSNVLLHDRTSPPLPPLKIQLRLKKTKSKFKTPSSLTHSLERRVRKFIFPTKPASVSLGFRRPKGQSLGRVCFCDARLHRHKPILQCNYCESWYHLECVNISQEQACAMDEFMCLKCSRKRHQTYPFHPYTQSSHFSESDLPQFRESQAESSTASPIPMLDSLSDLSYASDPLPDEPMKMTIQSPTLLDNDPIPSQSASSSKIDDSNHLPQPPLILKIRMSRPSSSSPSVTTDTDENSRRPLLLNKETVPTRRPSSTPPVTSVNRISTPIDFVEKRTKRKAKERFEELMKWVRSDSYRSDD